VSLDKDFVLSGLLQHNFLPMQKKDKEEMPPIFSSESFSPVIAKKLIAGKCRKSSDYQGYDVVDYKLTRFNGISRSCSIPHPVAYAELALAIFTNWGNLEFITKNMNSFIRPRKHRDGRLIVMDYERSSEKSSRSLRAAFGCRFMVHTDISNCFPSIYSHAIPWATVGFDHAKKHKPPKHQAEWFNQLDEKLRKTKRNETQGIAIGPATSNVLSETILTKIDEQLQKEFTYFRFIDDYTAYFETEEKAQHFLRRLGEELAKYKLLLNIKKTKVSSLPLALTDGWIGELALRLPSSGKVSGHDAVSFLNLAVGIANVTPDGSVLKYALKSVMRRLEPNAKLDLLRYALTLSFHQTALLPLLGPLLDAAVTLGKFQFGHELLRIALENARCRRSDGIAWSLYYLNKHGVPIDAEIASEIILTRDCIGLLLLYQSGDISHKRAVLDFVNSLDRSALYELDQYWLLLYQLYFAKQIQNPYTDEDAFENMRANDLSFLKM